MTLDAMDRLMSKIITHIGRRVYKDADLNRKGKDATRSYDSAWNPTATTLEDPDANLVSSRLETQPSGRLTPAMHAPALDLDVPCHLVASSTPGHFHLYIDKPIPWEKYRRLLEVLEECALIEKGFLISSVNNRASFLRLPHIKKEVPDAQ